MNRASQDGREGAAADHRWPGAMVARYRMWPGLAAVSLLAACASVPRESANIEAPAAGAKDSATLATQRPPLQKRGGGYYKDDGPGDDPPPNLDQIADAQPRFEPIIVATTRPYTALGYSFTPMARVQPFTQRGLASWYGKRFHGAPTSSGEPYNMYAMTAAHPTLPIPSYARVTNVANGKSVVVRVNDRGPFHADRVMDLSYTAAWKLGYVNRGSTEVLVEAILPDDLDTLVANKSAPAADPRQAVAGAATRRAARVAALPKRIVASASSATASLPPAKPDQQLAAAVSAPAPVPATTSGADPAAMLADAASAVPQGASDEAAPARRGFFLQLGAFSLSANAENLRQHVREQLGWLREEVATLMVGGKYRLHVGPFENASEARRVAQRISQSIKLQAFLVER